MWITIPKLLGTSLKGLAVRVWWSVESGMRLNQIITIVLLCDNNVVCLFELSLKFCMMPFQQRKWVNSTNDFSSDIFLHIWPESWHSQWSGIFRCLLEPLCTTFQYDSEARKCELVDTSVSNSVTFLEMNINSGKTLMTGQTFVCIFSVFAWLRKLNGQKSELEDTSGRFWQTVNTKRRTSGKHQ